MVVYHHTDKCDSLGLQKIRSISLNVGDGKIDKTLHVIDTNCFAFFTKLKISHHN